MRKLERQDLCSLEQYADTRAGFRAQVLAHKEARKVHLGAHLTLLFEDRMTIQYQIQEMLRIERIFERKAIQEELDAYNPLIPDGTNLKATMLIEYDDAEARRAALATLRCIEQRIWLRAAGHAPVYAIADEDLERENDEKTAAVHFLRFEFTPEMVASLRAGAALGCGVDHEQYRYAIDALSEPVRCALAADFD